MGNSNQELLNEIQKLKRRLEKLEQSKTPHIGRYEGQTWYDKINKQLKIWDGKEYIGTGSSSGGINIKSGQLMITSTGNASVTGLGFTPKSIRYDAVAGSRAVSWMQTDGVYNNGARVTRTSSNAIDIQSTSRASDLWNYSTNQYALVDHSSFDADGFTVIVPQLDFNVTLNWTAYG